MPFVASALTTAQQADSAYNKEDYRLAIELYNRALAQDGASSTIYYNLGNAYFRNDKLGKAVLSYERALRINPTNKDAQTNLEFVRNRIQDKPEDDSPFLSNLHHSIVSLAKANTWAWITFTSFLLLIGSIALYIFSKDVKYRKIGFFCGLALIFIFIYLLIVANDSVKIARSHESAVVTVPSTLLNSAPRAPRGQGEKVVALHEGTVVMIIDSIATPDDPVSPYWYNVKINNGTEAWLRSSDVERI